MASLVLRYRDGTTEKREGECEVDFDAQYARLVDIGGASKDVSFADLKAIFFLKSQSAAESPPADSSAGSIVAVEFEDGEVIRGVTTDYRPGRAGFVLHPLDQTSHGRIFVVASAVLSIDVEKL